MIISHSRRHTYTVYAATFFLAAACVLLLVFANRALAAAAEALTLWWTRVLPALFPFYVLTSMLCRLGAFERLQRLLGGAFLPCFLMGAAAGNPTGARLGVLLMREEYAAICNLCSPMFLLGVVAVGLCQNAAMLWPLAVAHYLSALLLLPFVRRYARGLSDMRPAIPPPQAASSGAGLFSDIGGGVLAMLNIGGCIVFFYVLSDTLLASAPARFPLLSAVLMGLMEMTAGCARVAALPLPTEVAAGLLAFFTTFGGICVFAQVMITAPLRRPGMYLLTKLMQGCLAGILAYLLAPLFLHGSEPAWSSGAEAYAQNALIGLTFLLCAGVGLVASYLLALLIKRARAGSPGSRPIKKVRRSDRL